MFENLAPKKDVEDIFAETDKNLAPNMPPVNMSAPRVTPVVPPMAPVSSGPVITPMPQKVAPVMNVMEPATKSKMDKVIKSLIIVIIVLALIGAAAYFIYTKFLDKQVDQYQAVTETPINENNAEIPALEEPQTTPAPVITPTPVEASTTTEATSTISAPIVKDADADGLSDEEEISLGTNINNIDTDADGLSDYDEVKVYRTNPKIVDTDGDGYKDGDEVKNGFNPNGAGKLVK